MPNIDIKNAFETIRDFCKSRVDGCSECKFAVRGTKCSLFNQYPCNWGKFNDLYIDNTYLTKELYISMCPLKADLLLEKGGSVCRNKNGDVVKCGLDKCALHPLAFCPECGGEHMEVTGDSKSFYIECYNFGKIPCGFECGIRGNSVAELCLEFDKKYLYKE